jgi:hypothetical protein
VRDDKPYNPLDKRNLGVSVADAILERTIGPLPPQDSFNGAGIYAIYYFGTTFTPYERIAAKNGDGNFDWPIYVGKAVPVGARKGGFGLDVDPGRVLFKRLVEHSKSIEQAVNLDLCDFRCRYLVVEDIWIPLGESLLIEKFSPVWNRTIDGFGNHAPGSGRYKQQRSPWDVLLLGVLGRRSAWITTALKRRLSQPLTRQFQNTSKAASKAHQSVFAPHFKCGYCSCLTISAIVCRRKL